MPDGAWLSGLDIAYNDAALLPKPPETKTGRRQRNTPTKEDDDTLLKMTIDGYAYSENKNRQFRIVNQFLRSIKSNAEVAKIFQNIDLETTAAQKLNDFNVTYFKIVCRQKK